MNCAGIAGVQLERQLEPGRVAGVPALSGGARVLAALGLLGAGMAGLRAARHVRTG